MSLSGYYLEGITDVFELIFAASLERAQLDIAF